MGDMGTYGREGSPVELYRYIARNADAMVVLGRWPTAAFSAVYYKHENIAKNILFPLCFQVRRAFHFSLHPCRRFRLHLQHRQRLLRSDGGRSRHGPVPSQRALTCLLALPVTVLKSIDTARRIMIRAFPPLQEGLPESFPVFAAVGNHDVSGWIFNQYPYVSGLAARQERTGIDQYCWGDLVGSEAALCIVHTDCPAT